LGKVNAKGLLAKQGPISRLTGADVEARLEFELASQQVIAAIGQLRLAAENGRRVRTLLTEARGELIAEQDQLEEVIVAAKRLLETSRDPDDFVRTRFERRLSNLMAMQVANVATMEQIGLALDVLSGLLDRMTDIDTVLLPLWQRNVVALVHAAAGRSQRQAAAEFGQSHASLITHLKQEVGDD
jgi:hypothetical protein